MTRLWLLLVLPLAGCGGYPQPFNGNPGATAARLSLPPPPRLVVMPPSTALLDDAGAAAYAQDVADALADRAVPAVVGAGAKGDWRLAISADLQHNQVTPRYTVENPKGISQGNATGAPVPAADWSQAAPPALHTAATADAPAIAALLDRINAARELSDPNSLVNRPARLAIQPVTGAPGDGNRALTAQITQQLSDLGIVVQNTTQGADYALAGTVTLSPSTTAGQSRVEVQWIVKDPYGKEVGHVLQINDVPQGTLDHYWGDIALVVAQEAAGGVREVMVNRTEAKRIKGRQEGQGAPPPGPPPGT